MQLLLSLALLLTTGACANFNRSRESGYAEFVSKNEAPKSAWEAVEEQRASVELGLDADANSEAELQTRIQVRVKLRQLERSLKSTREQMQYYRYGNFMKSDLEKLRFLQLGTFEAKQAYIRKMKIGAGTETPSSEIQEQIEKEDISVGMKQEFVKRSWGDPQQIEVSGNPAFKNEKWSYQKYVASPEGFRMQKRRVYFEGGQVSGWETD